MYETHDGYYWTKMIEKGHKVRYLKLLMFCVILQVEIVKPVEKKTPEEKRLDDKYLNQFKGVKEIKKCTVSKSLH